MVAASVWLLIVAPVSHRQRGGAAGICECIPYDDDHDDGYETTTTIFSDSSSSSPIPIADISISSSPQLHASGISLSEDAGYCFGQDKQILTLPPRLIV